MQNISVSEIAIRRSKSTGRLSLRKTETVRAFRLPAAATGISLSSVIMAIAVPPSSWGFLAWIAIVPLIMIVQRQSFWRAFLSGLLFGVASSAGMHFWLWKLPAFNFFDAIALFGYLALYPAFWCGAISWLSGKSLPVVLPGALLWVILDWTRSHAGPLSLPWEPLAHSQVVDLFVLQLAAFGGASAVTFAVCLANLAIAQAIKKRSRMWLVWTSIGIAALHFFGYLMMPEEKPGSGPRIAVIQPADDGDPQAIRLNRLRSMTVAAAGEKPDLIIWPESAVNGYIFSNLIQSAVADIARSARIPILFGSADFGKYANAAGNFTGRIDFKNQAYLVFPDGKTEGPYTKNRLVPFGEFMPFEQYIEWPKWLIRRQLHGIAGDTPGLFRLRDGTTVGSVICWENFFAGLSERLVHGGASMIVQLSNDSDFGASAEPAQHNAASILRAVEIGRPWVVASSNGPSTLIEADGRIVESLGPVGHSGWVIGKISLSNRTTFYERYGLLWLWLASMMVLFYIVARLLIRRKNVFN